MVFIWKRLNDEIFLGFGSDGEAVVLKDCQVVVEYLFRKEEAIKKIDKDPIDNHDGNEEGFEQELWNEEIESIKQRILNELCMVQETKMTDKEPLNKINITKRKGPDRTIEPGNGINNLINLPRLNKI